jgi:DNA-binding NtrC family response regulator
MANILVVDDNRDIATPLIMYLEFEGHTVRYAENGEAGLAAVQEQFPEVIFLDIEMPVLNGPGMAYRLLVEDCGKENIPIIVVSAVADLAAVVNRIGTPYFVAKPFHLDAIRALLTQALLERRAPRPREYPAAEGAA